jgi:molybdopterin converting factor small subunit
MARVFLSNDMLSGTGGLDVVTIDAPRVHELIHELVTRFPALNTDMFGRLAVAIDGEIHTDADYLPLTSDSEVHFVPRIAGGTNSR